MSCNREADQVGLQVQPTEDQLEVKLDTSSNYYTYSTLVDVDSVRTKNLSTKPYLGSFYDPSFGKTTVGYYSRILKSSDTIPIVENTFVTDIDSVVLVLGYTGILIGDTNSLMNLRVFELQENLSSEDDVFYHANEEFDVYPFEIASKSFNSGSIDSLDVDGANFRQIRIPITNAEFLQRLYNADPIDNETFSSDLKGLYLSFDEAVEEGKGALLRFDLENKAYLRLYHTKSSQVKHITYNLSGTDVSVYEHDYTTANEEIQKQVLEGDTISGNQMIYLQGYAGLESKAFLTDIDAVFQNRNIAINRASLTVYAEIEEGYNLPPQLVLLAIDDDGDTYGIMESDEVDLETGSYTMHFPRHFQDLILDPDVNHGSFLLKILGSTLSPYRMKIYGPESDEKPMEFKVIYTELD